MDTRVVLPPTESLRVSRERKVAGLAVDQQLRKCKGTMGVIMKNELVVKFEKNQQAIAKLNKEIEKAVGTQIQKMRSLEEQQAEMKEAMLEAMEANDVDKFDGDLITITRVKATTRTTFDSKKFAEERPKTYAKYLKTSATKAYIKLKVKA